MYVLFALSLCVLFPPSIQDNKELDKVTNDENTLLSDNYTPSPSDEDYVHTLDCKSKSDKLSGPENYTVEFKASQEPHTSQDLSSEAIIPAPTEEETQVPCPVPKPRISQQATPSSVSSPPIAKPRTIHLSIPSTPEKPSPLTSASDSSKPSSGSHLKQSLRKLQLTDEEKSQLVNLHSLSGDSDSETPGGSSSCSSSSATVGGPSPPKPHGLNGQEEEGYWSGSTASNYREKKQRRGIKKKELPSGQTRVRSKFSPWNLSSPRISRDTRLSVLINHPGREGRFSIKDCFVLPLEGTTPRHLTQCFVAFPSETFLHSASEEGVDGDDDDEDDMFEQDDLELNDEKVS